MGDLRSGGPLPLSLVIRTGDQFGLAQMGPADWAFPSVRRPLMQDGSWETHSRLTRTDDALAALVRAVPCGVPLEPRQNVLRHDVDHDDHPLRV